ncbi:hypothetical protein BH10BAC3_BH10BAC3_14810 [soil metagenome]
MELVVIGGGISGALISHALVEKGIEETQGYAVNYPMIGDPTLAIAKLYDMLHAEEPRHIRRQNGRYQQYGAHGLHNRPRQKK